MDQETRLDRALHALGSSPPGSPTDGFMDGVWLRAGQLAEAAEARRRLALFAAVFVTGLGAGFWTIQEPAEPLAPDYQLVEGADLSPAALLHLQS